MRDRAHPCPHCKCLPIEGDPYFMDDMGQINYDAPFYPLVSLIDDLTGQYGILGAGRRNAFHDRKKVRS
jgi:hypothetical protein